MVEGPPSGCSSRRTRLPLLPTVCQPSSSVVGLGSEAAVPGGASPALSSPAAARRRGGVAAPAKIGQEMKATGDAVGNEKSGLRWGREEDARGCEWGYAVGCEWGYAVGSVLGYQHWDETSVVGCLGRDVCPECVQRQEDARAPKYVAV